MKAVLIMGSTSDQPHADKKARSGEAEGKGKAKQACDAHKHPEGVFVINQKGCANARMFVLHIVGRSMW